jgi:cytochrome P450
MSPEQVRVVLQGKPEGAASPPHGSPLSSDLDFLDRQILENPYPLYARLREEQPVFWSTQMDAWVITRHADVTAALRDPGLFSSARVEKIVYGYAERRLRTMPFGAALRPLVRKMTLIKMGVFVEMASRFMWQQDPPDHTRLRKLMMQGFTAETLRKARPLIERRVHALLDAVCDTGQMDFMRDFAVPLPAMIIADIFGLPDHWEQLHRWENDLKLFLGARRGDARRALDDALTSVAKMKEFFLAEIRDRRAAPRDDLISKLANAQEDGYYLNDLELCANLLVTLGAAQVTTQDMLGNGMLALLRHPGQLDALVADRSLVANAMDEIIRYDGPVQLTNRVVTRDTELRGIRLKAGQMVYLIRGAANRDPEVFPDADIFDIRRDSRRHVAFGAGIHYCIGAALARAEGEVAFNAVFDRLGAIRLAPEGAASYRADNFQFRGLKELCLQFNPSKPVESGAARVARK